MVLPKAFKNKLPLIILLIITISAFLYGTVYSAQDNEPPVTTLSTNPSNSDGENGWFISYPEIILEATDTGSGIKAINWKINDGEWNRREFEQNFNLFKNQSFEQGTFSNWHLETSGNDTITKESDSPQDQNYYVEINSNNSQETNLRNGEYLRGQSLETYYYRFYARSNTPDTTNLFIRAENKNGHIAYETSGIQLNSSWTEINGSFTTDSADYQHLLLSIGIKGEGNLQLDNSYISLSEIDPEVRFDLTQEGTNTIYYYSEDGAGNTETTKTSQVKIDVTKPTFTNFTHFNEINEHKFQSKIDVIDQISGLVDSPAYFNYSVNSSNPGYYEDYANCSGNFIEDDYLNLSSNYSYGANSGEISTPLVDYCDTIWTDCKELNFYIKDVAGHENQRSVCVNGPYISTKNANIYAKTSIGDLGTGEQPNLTGTAVSGGSIASLHSTTNNRVSNYEKSQTTQLYEEYLFIYQDSLQSSSSINTNSGAFYIDQNTSINNDLNYTNTNQIVFVNGNLNINSNVYTDGNSFVTYMVSGDITISNSVSNLDVLLYTQSNLYTSENNDLAENIIINGMLAGNNLNLTRNTDKTQGPSEEIIFPLEYYLTNTPLDQNNLYWREITE